MGSDPELADSTVTGALTPELGVELEPELGAEPAPLVGLVGPVLTGSLALMVILISAVAVRFGDSASFTFTVNTNVPLADGVPLNSPFDVSSVMPAGSWPAVMLQV